MYFDWKIKVTYNLQNGILLGAESRSKAEFGKQRLENAPKGLMRTYSEEVEDELKQLLQPDKDESTQQHVSKSANAEIL